MHSFEPGRRTLMTGAAASAAPFRPGLALAQLDDLAAIRSAVETGYAASVARIQDWIRNPAIAAEDYKNPEGAAYMADLARDAGFTDVEVMPTDRHPGVFGIIDNGAER